MSVGINYETFRDSRQTKYTISINGHHQVHKILSKQLIISKALKFFNTKLF